jgi:hypothetical protein
VSAPTLLIPAAEYGDDGNCSLLLVMTQPVKDRVDPELAKYTAPAADPTLPLKTQLVIDRFPTLLLMPPALPPKPEPNATLLLKTQFVIVRAFSVSFYRIAGVSKVISSLVG